MEANEEWSVPNSDDERDEALLNLPQNGCQDLPVKILKYYEEIEKNKVLELNVEEFRKPFKQDDVEEDKDSSLKDVKVESTEDDDENTATSDDDEKLNEPSAFDYLEEPDECQGQIPKRTPKTGRLPKKRVGTLKNVISNLKRFKELDSSTNEEFKPFSEDNKNESNEDLTEHKKDVEELE